MRIAFVTEVFSPSIGGQEVRYLELGRHLVCGGHTVCVYTIRLATGHAVLESLDGIEVHRVVDGFNYRRVGRIRRNPLDIVKFTLRMLKERTTLMGFDAVVFNIWPVLTPLVVPRLVRARSILDWCEIRTSPAWDLTYRFLANPNVFHAAVSDAIAEQLTRAYNVPPTRIRTILSGVDVAQYRCDPCAKRDTTILYLGRLSWHKDPLMLLTAFLSAELHRKGYTLHIAGDGPLLADIERESRGAPNVLVHGAVGEGEKISLLQQSTLLVLPSRREGFPRVVAEAAAAGTPTLTVDHPGNGTVSVVVQYGIGWVCPPKPHKMAAFLERHARMSEEWTTRSSHCARIAQEKFDWGAVTRDFLAFLRSLS